MTRNAIEENHDHDGVAMDGSTRIGADGGRVSNETRGNNSGPESVEGADRTGEKTNCNSALRRKQRYSAYLFLAFMSLVRESGSI